MLCGGLVVRGVISLFYPVVVLFFEDRGYLIERVLCGDGCSFQHLLCVFLFWEMCWVDYASSCCGFNSFCLSAGSVEKEWNEGLLKDICGKYEYFLMAKFFCFFFPFKTPNREGRFFSSTFICFCLLLDIESIDLWEFIANGLLWCYASVWVFGVLIVGLVRGVRTLFKHAWEYWWVSRLINKMKKREKYCWIHHNQQETSGVSGKDV